MAAYWIWWILAGALVAAEVATGTFFLLALGIAFTVGGLVAFAGAGFELQLLAASVLSIAGVFLAHRWRQRRTLPPPDRGYDIGQSVRVQAWNPDGTARVAYRGTLWVAETASPDTPRADTMYIAAMRGSTLVISDRRP